MLLRWSKQGNSWLFMVTTFIHQYFAKSHMNCFYEAQFPNSITTSNKYMKSVYSLSSFNPRFFMKSLEHLCKTSKTFHFSSLKELMCSLIMSPEKSTVCLCTVLLYFNKICISIFCIRFIRLLILLSMLYHSVVVQMGPCLFPTLN